MEIYGEISKVRAAVKAWKKEGLTVGFVPTMGYLHEGHKSLIDAARKENDRVVVSIFVNPMQFGPTEDLESYPRDLKKDAALCEAAGVDIIFHPEPEEMYADGFCSYVDMNGLTTELCGKSRPIHFRGVQTVVLKLFHIVTPDRAYFGQKDAQQLAVIRRMVKDLNVDTLWMPEKHALVSSSLQSQQRLKKSRLPRLITWMSLTLTPLLRSKNSKVPFL